jgi:hypothetical protein
MASLLGLALASTRVTIVRDRLQDAIKKGMTLEQVMAARLVRDYEGRYGATAGGWTTDAFVDAA